MADQLTDFGDYEISVAMTAQVDAVLADHVHKGAEQEDLAFAYWRPSVGQHRYTAVITNLVLPEDGDRVLNGNVAFYPQYLLRVLAEVPEGSGIAFLHGHPKPGWQGMSDDDIVAERDRLAGQVAGCTRLPLLGLTRGTDGAWSGRIWMQSAPRSYVRKDAQSVRVVGRELAVTFHPNEPVVMSSDSQVATLSVWGEKSQERLVRTRIGIVGLGSVGSLVAESLSRMGLWRLTYIDFDKLEIRNLDRTLGATREDAESETLKVEVAARTTKSSATAADLDIRIVPHSLLSAEGLAAALDCDVLFSCVDRPWPRHLLNTIAYSHLVPVIDGGIMAKVKPDGTPQHVAWRIHTVGPDHACMVCLGALRRSDVALDMAGMLDNPDYIAGLSEEDKAAISRRNVFPFSMSVAAHEVLQFVGLVTGMPRIGGIGAQTYDAYPGAMEAEPQLSCADGCEFAELTATAVNLRTNLDSASSQRVTGTMSNDN